MRIHYRPYALTDHMRIAIGRAESSGNESDLELRQEVSDDFC